METKVRAPMPPSLGDEDTVERLVRLASPGPAIPADGAARVKAVLRPQWRREVRARSVRRGVVWAGAGLAAAATLAVAVTTTSWLHRPSLREPVATLTAVAGAVEVSSP